MVRLTSRIQALRLFHVEQARPVRGQTAKQVSCQQPPWYSSCLSKTRANSPPGTILALARGMPAHSGLDTYKQDACQQPPWNRPCLSKTRATHILVWLLP